MSSVVARGALAACLLLFVQSPAVRYDSARNLFLLENWSGAAQLPAERYPDVFQISVDVPDVPPMLGQYRVEAGALVFSPQYPAQPGVKYRAVARIPGSAPITVLVDIPKPAVKSTTVVERIYPSVDVLPENQLKFYIHFSAPMARGFGYEHIVLRDERGAVVEVPFLELTEELWDPTGQRFTLFFDPGRIKRGLVSQQQLGMALKEGGRYTLSIDKGWKDAQGNPLAADFQKVFTVGPADRQSIDLRTWSVKEPASGTRNPLTLVFPEPLDHAILERDLDVVDASGAVIHGGVTIGPEEKSWIFTPDMAWKSGIYTIRLGTAIADLAGNMINRPFEIDVFDKVDEEIPRFKYVFPFTVR
jgi:hypothetical protein